MYQPVDPVAPLKPLLPWEGGEVQTNCWGFTAKASNLLLTLGYATYGNGVVLLYVREQIGPAPPATWRAIWTTRECAVELAEALCSDVEDYLNSLRMPWRPVEDLEMEDYLEHMTLRLSGQFH